MTCQRLTINGHTAIVCGPSKRDFGECICGWRRIRWEYHDYLGPSFELLSKSKKWVDFAPPIHHGVWKVFDRWFKDREAKE